MNMTNLFHILFVAPLLFYIGYFKSEVPVYIFNWLMIIAIFVLFYHSYQFYKKY